MSNSPLGMYLRELRKTTDYKQVDIAAIIDKSRQSVSAYEAGETTPPPEVINQLAEIYNISPNELIELIPVEDYIDSPNSSLDSVVNKKGTDNRITSQNLAKMHAMFTQLSPADQTLALQVMELFFFSRRNK